MRYFQFTNWAKYQHYKKRCPPWIKLHQALLRDRDFMALPEALRWHCVGLMLVASQHDNRIPMDLKWLRSEIRAKAPIDFTRLFASGMLAWCGQNADSETEAEAYTTPEAETDARDAMNLDPIPEAYITEEDRIVRAWDDLLAGAGLPMGSIPLLPAEARNDQDSLTAAVAYALDLLGGRAPLEARLKELVAYHAAGKGPDGKRFKLYSLRNTLRDPQLLKVDLGGRRNLNADGYHDTKHDPKWLKLKDEAARKARQSKGGGP